VIAPRRRRELLPADGESIDAAGKFLISGIIGARGHVWPQPGNPQLRRYPLDGVN
jgi:hypothetical protein